jgi:cytochrome c oxidase subunit 2
MTVRGKRHTSLRWIAVALAALPLLAAGCRLIDYPQSSLNPQSDYAWSIQHLLDKLAFWVVVIFVLVQGLLIVAVMRFRSRPGAPEPKPVHGNTALEVGWTIAPALILLLIAVPTVMTIFKTQAKPPANALEVKVVGHQWWWEFQYPSLGIVTADEMHVPVGKPIAIDIETADVIHSFWFPAMGGKRDAIPSRTNHMLFTADSLGTFPGQCAELCGLSHANMRMKLMVERPEEFAAWVREQQAAPVEPDSTTPAGHGKLLFSQSACIGCHTIAGVSAGVIGPNLTHVGSRTTLAGGILPNTPEAMAKWITDAPAQKPGSLMPNMAGLGITPDQVPALVAYLQSLK